MRRPTASTRRPTKRPVENPVANTTIPQTLVPVVANTSQTKIPTRAPLLLPPPVRRPTAPTIVPTPTDVIQPLNGTRPPSFLNTRTPVVAPTKRPSTNSSLNVTTLVPMAAPVVVPNNATTLAPVRRPVATAVPIAIVGTIIHRINCGSTNQVIVPPNNLVWTPDHYVTNGRSYNTCHANATATTNTTASSSIYCTSRYFRTIDATPYRYALPVPVSNRSYPVRLHFAEQVRCGLVTIVGKFNLLIKELTLFGFLHASRPCMFRHSIMFNRTNAFLMFLWKVSWSLIT